MSLGDVMRKVIDDYQLYSKLDEIKAAEAWVKVIGSQFAAMSPRPTVKGGVMTVRLTSAALRHEFSLNRSRLTAAINREVGREVITDIRFIS